MYKIEKKGYGFKLAFGGSMKVDEVKRWVEESKTALVGAPKEFGVLIDMRTLQPLLEDAQTHMKEGQKLYKAKGMLRSVVILNSPIVTLQFKRIAKETGIYAWERHIDASAVTDWEKVGIDWISKGIDPDK